MCVLLPHWPIDRLRRKQPAYRHKPVVLIESTATRQKVIAVSKEATHLGIRPGMTLAEARALYAQVMPAPHEADRDARALVALGKWMTRFSPVVATGRGLTPIDSEQSASLFLDVTGCERLYGGLGCLMKQVADCMHSLDLTARVAIAPTPGAAWAIAFAGQDQSVVGQEDLSKVLATLSPRALRIEEEIVNCLRHLGLQTIGQLIALPRALLPARFGRQLLLRLDQALGRVAEPLVPLIHEEPVQAAMDFDGVIQSLETLWVVFQQLLRDIITQLAKRGAGARRLDARFLRPHAAPIEKTILLSRPTRDAQNLFNLLRCALEDVKDPEFRVLGSGRKKRIAASHHMQQAEFTPDGFTGLRLSVPLFEKISADQIGLLQHEQHAGEIEFDHFIERLRIRLGPNAITQADLVESYIPERACRLVEPISTRVLSARKRPVIKQKRKNVEEEKFVCPSFRPLHLLGQPAELRVMVSPSDDRNGRPVSFTHAGEVHRVIHSAGPERIAGQWWDAHHKTRDYFDVEDLEGKRFWMFRVVQSGKWYLHGVFE